MAGDLEYDRMISGVDDYGLDASLGLETSGLSSQCHVCLKSFVSPKGLQQHSIVHTDKKPFVCEVCQKPFRFKSNLFEHRSIHTGEQPYICPFCSKACRLKGNLKKHLKTHIKESEEIERAYEAVTGATPMNSSIYRGVDSGDDSLYESMLNKNKRRKTIHPRKISKAPSVGLVVTVGQDEDSEPYTDAPIKRPDPKTLVADSSVSLAEFLDVVRFVSFDSYKCRLCHLIFPTKMDMEMHAESVHQYKKDVSGDGSDDQSLVWCRDCLIPFDDSKVYEKHMNFHQQFKAMIDSGDFRMREPKAMFK